MAVVARRGKAGTTYRIAIRDADGKQFWEPVGTDKRAAEMLDRQRKREVKAGTYVRGPRPTMPFGEYLDSWVAGRRNRNKKDDHRIVDTYFRHRGWLASLPCEELRPIHAERLVRELLATVSEQTGRALGEKYVSNIYGLFRTACQDARRQELMFVDPCILPRGPLSRKYRQGTRSPYSIDSVRALLAPRTEASVFAALALLTGMREGEVCGVRWRDVDAKAVPLGSLHLKTQYDDALLKTERVANEHSRNIPVHPRLAEKLAWWWREGFELMNCRKPTPDDFVIPRRHRGGTAAASAGS